MNIEKLDFDNKNWEWRMLVDKINEIIDHLNSGAVGGCPSIDSMPNKPKDKPVPSSPDREELDASEHRLFGDKPVESPLPKALRDKPSDGYKPTKEDAIRFIEGFKEMVEMMLAEYKKSLGLK